MGSCHKSMPVLVIIHVLCVAKFDDPYQSKTPCHVSRVGNGHWKTRDDNISRDQIYKK